jgi:hypothetical protein
VLKEEAGDAIKRYTAAAITSPTLKSKGERREEGKETSKAGGHDGRVGEWNTSCLPSSPLSLE